MGVPFLSAQVPAPGNTDIGLRPFIQFTVNDGGTGIDFTTFQVWVNGTLAYDQSGGGFQSGYVNTVDWNIAGAVEFDAINNIISADFFQVAFFPDSTVIPIRVRVTDIGAANVLDSTWTFTTATSASGHGPYLQNAVTDNYISTIGSVFTEFDPLAFDLIVDPILGNTVDLTTFNFTVFGSPVVVGGVAQAGFVLSTTPILGGYRVEIQSASPWLGFFISTNWSASGTQPGSATGTTTYPLTIFIGPMASFPPAAVFGDFTSYQVTLPPGNVPPNWTGLQPSSGFLNIVSELGPPVIDLLTVSQNGGPPITIYDATASGFQLGWAGSQVNQLPNAPQAVPSLPEFPGNGPQGNQMLFGPTGPFASVGDTLVFNVTAHKVSPVSGLNYPITQTWTWNVINTLSTNPNPSSGSTNEPTNLVWQVSIDDFSNHALIQFNSIQATITPMSGPPVTSTVYTGGSFQAGWTGAGSNVQNNNTSNVTVNVDKSTPYNPGDQVSFFNLDAQAANVGESAATGPFTFTVLNVTYHVFQRGFDSGGTNGYCYWLSATPNQSPGSTTPQFTGTLLNYELIYQF